MTRFGLTVRLAGRQLVRARGTPCSLFPGGEHRGKRDARSRT